MKKIWLSKRFWGYFIIIGVYIVAVKVQQLVITARRQAPIISTSSEWAEKGKPVEAIVIRKHDVNQYLKTTVKVTGEPLVYEGYVSKSIQQKLSAGEDLYWIKQEGRLEVGDPVPGRVLFVSEESDITNGMYLLRIKFAASVPDEKNMIVVRVHYDTIHDSINIPIESFDMVDDSFYGWIVKDGRAHQVELLIKQRNGYGAIVDEGLNDGDVFILRGMTFLKENDLVDIVKYKE